MTQVIIPNGSKGTYMEHVNIGNGYIIRFDCLPDVFVGVKEEYVKEIE